MENFVKPTKKQRLAVQKIAEGSSVSKAMIEAGYTPASAKNPKNLTESVGFQQLCEENGLTKSLVIESLVEDINAKPQNRLGELNLAAKITGIVSTEDKPVSESKNTYNFIFSPEVQDRVKVINEDIKKLLTNVPENQDIMDSE